MGRTNRDPRVVMGQFFEVFKRLIRDTVEQVCLSDSTVSRKKMFVKRWHTSEQFIVACCWGKSSIPETLLSPGNPRSTLQYGVLVNTCKTKLDLAHFGINSNPFKMQRKRNRVQFTDNIELGVGTNILPVSKGLMRKLKMKSLLKYVIVGIICFTAFSFYQKIELVSNYCLSYFFLFK